MSLQSGKCVTSMDQHAHGSQQCFQHVVMRSGKGYAPVAEKGAYHLAGMDTVASECLIIWLAWKQCAERARVSGCSYHLAGMGTALSGCA